MKITKKPNFQTEGFGDTLANFVELLVSYEANNPIFTSFNLNLLFWQLWPPNAGLYVTLKELSKLA